MTDMSGNRAVQEYRCNNLHYAVEAATPHRLIQLMMEGVLSRIAMARGHMERSEIAGKGRRIGDAIGLVGGLKVSLNHEADTRLAGNFEALYDYMSRRLLEANLRNDPAILDEVSGLMRELKEAWEAAGSEISAGAPA